MQFESGSQNLRSRPELENKIKADGREGRSILFLIVLELILCQAVAERYSKRFLEITGRQQAGVNILSDLQNPAPTPTYAGLLTLCTLYYHPTA